MSSTMRPLFACWNEVAARLKSGRIIALFLDFDGTLAAIEPRPELVRVNPATRRALAALASNPRFRVWVISARRREDLRARVRVAGVRYLGLYGWERGASVPPPISAIAHLRILLSTVLPSHPAVWIENKQHTIAVHYRGAPDAVRRTTAERLHRAIAPWRKRLRIVPGKCVWEVLPLELAGKGVAVRRELAALPSNALPVYIGDDLSDEDAFAALPTGLAVRVGLLRLTRARYRVNGTADVRRFLERLEAEAV